MAQPSLYASAHLFVAAARVLLHQHKTPPAMEDICRLLTFSGEQGGIVGRRLAAVGAIEMVDSPYGMRIFVRDHLRIEELPKEDLPDRLSEEVQRFQSAQKERASKVESMRAEQKKKKQDLFAEMEKKLKAEIEKKTSG
jgi:hypothetical protein